MAADGSVVIDVTVDTEALAASLSSLDGLVNAAAARIGAGASGTLSGAICSGINAGYQAGVSAVSGAGFENIGMMISQGLANGISAGSSAVQAAAASVAEKAKSAIANSVRVQSPSKWAEQIGAFIDEGLANGVSGGVGIVTAAADELMSRFKNTVEAAAQEAASLEIAALDSVIEAERQAIKERERSRQLELRQHAIDIAVDQDVKRRAIEYLATTEREYALQDLEQYRNTLSEKQKAFEQQKNEQIRAIKDISYEEREAAYGDYELKIQLYSDEYLEKVRNIDAGLYHFLSAKNAEMEAVIERIALEDSATAERLAAILEEKNALLEKSRVEKELREQRLSQEKEAELLKRIWEAESLEEEMKRTSEYYKWREEEQWRLAEKGRKERVSALEQEYDEIIATVRAAQGEIDLIRKQGDAEIARAAEEIRDGIVDIEAEKENLTASEEQQKAHIEASYKMTTDYYASRTALVAAESQKEYTFLEQFNESVAALMARYIPVWREIGVQLMTNLYYGLSERLSEVNSLVSRLRSQLESLDAYASGGDNYPMYGTGGIVTTPRLAVVGDVPEAIIPLDRLNDIITRAAYYAAPSLAAGGGETAQGKTVYINQTNNIYQPVKSPAETAREIRRVSRGLANQRY